MTEKKHSFKAGDKVRLRLSNGFDMVVSGIGSQNTVLIDTNMVRVIWIEDRSVHRGVFESETLEPIPAA